MRPNLLLDRHFFSKSYLLKEAVTIQSTLELEKGTFGVNSHQPVPLSSPNLFVEGAAADAPFCYHHPTGHGLTVIPRSTLLETL